ncbi:MAG: BON domain-containing protein [Blastocatellia bacterium]|nr:BON domain-containing protein [Blastocatellia bacterium]
MTYKTDEEIKSEVLFQLGWDTHVRETEVGVVVRKGVVTLMGTVDSYAKKLAAQEAAHRVCGVLDVANEIEVRLSSDPRFTDDATIAHAVRHALEWNVLVPDERIHSTVTGGWVTLEGNVEYYTERTDAERAVSHLAGVRGVINKIEVSAPVDTEKIKLLIEDVLELRADREARRIEVKIDRGEVTLNGLVSTWDEKKAIVGAIGHTPGVRIIHDRLTVDPYGGQIHSARA